LIEEGIRGLVPSSFEISLPAERVNIPKPHAYQHRIAPQTMLNRTTNYAEAHHKAKVNRPRNTNQNSKQRSKRKQKSRTSAAKNFSRLILTV